MDAAPPPPLPVPYQGLRPFGPARGPCPPDPRIGLNGLVLKRRTGWKTLAGG
ncbi:hypothetical protein [Streptomyces sp. NPDC001401]|uniref:hypothetical protein n=1 Tax=Streptomyces sp. NPDC001401 TaxID=3364570 RepID=UPI0036A3F5D9